MEELTEAKKMAKHWFIEFIRGSNNPSENGTTTHYDFRRIQNAFNAADVRFKMYEGASQEYYMQIILPSGSNFEDENGRVPGFTDDNMLRAIFDKSPVSEHLDDYGYSIRNEGSVGHITFKRDNLKDRRELRQEGDEYV